MSLASAVRTFPVASWGNDGTCVAAFVGGSLRLAIGPVAGGSLVAVTHREPGFHATCTSRSATTGAFGLLAVSSGRAGLDIETRARVALNTSVEDPWLAPAERARVRHAVDPLAELACCWVLKEAYGKALGVGLDLPLDRLAFGARRGVICLNGGTEPGSWQFALYRHADALMATAWDRTLQPTPLAPSGRKPPTAPFDRQIALST